MREELSFQELTLESKVACRDIVSVVSRKETKRRLFDNKRS